MNDFSARRPSLRHWILWAVTVVIAVAILFVTITCLKIIHEADRQELHPVDAIVVFGAAEYAGRPSPVYRARLDHAFDLFQKGIAPVVITTGGAGADPDYSEGGVGRDYLVRRGIPERNLIAETQSSDSAQSAQRVAVILRANGMHTCLAVSDEYHVFRIKELLENQGLKVYVAPRPGSRPHSWWQRALAVLRESISYLLWRLHLPV
ncbi:MAG TPA: YdcF family protein [Terriglobales bacterium]|nr:YdcF family protein [Terriglobales bacterium]